MTETNGKWEAAACFGDKRPCVFPSGSLRQCAENRMCIGIFPLHPPPLSPAMVVVARCVVYPSTPPAVVSLAPRSLLSPPVTGEATCSHRLRVHLQPRAGCFASVAYQHLHEHNKGLFSLAEALCIHTCVICNETYIIIRICTYYHELK